MQNAADSLAPAPVEDAKAEAGAAEPAAIDAAAIAVQADQPQLESMTQAAVPDIPQVKIINSLSFCRQ